MTNKPESGKDEALIDEANKIINDYTCVTSRFISDVSKDIIEAVRQNDSRDAPNGWISVEDGLPDKPEHYLTAHKDNGLWVDLWYIHKKRFGSVGAGDITHWQSLPQPPKP